MRFFKLTSDNEYYIVENDNRPFFWFYDSEKRWCHTSEEIWNEWKQSWEKDDIEEVCALEVLVVCGTVPGYKMAP